MSHYELVVDNFAGGGGASAGIRNAIGRDVDIAINHDPSAIAMHMINHPTAKHYQEDVWKVDPVQACGGVPVALAWFSPDCKHFSKAKGGKPVDRKIRGLAWVAVRWAKAVKPRVIMMENVEEIQTWGPLLPNGKPDPERAGETYNAFIHELESCGYQVETKEMTAAFYGVPTTRKRWFLIARCDGQPIVWPAATHASPNEERVKSGELLPWRSIAEVLDFSIPCPSIFASKEEILSQYGINAVRPLADSTMRRIARGVMKFVVNNPNPFIVKPGNGVCDTISPNLIQYHSEKNDEVRGQAVIEPIMTVDSSNRYGLVCTFLTQFNSSPDGQTVDKPIGTITSRASHFGEVRAFLVKYYGNGENSVSCNAPSPTITARDRMGLVTVRSQDYQIVDIGLRMLTPRELFNAMGFPSDYIIDHDVNGKEITRAAQVARCGNAVCPPMAEALVRANLPELCIPKEEVEVIAA